MPLSLLLAQHLTFLTRGVKKLDRWEGLTDTFALVARRLRGAFMVGWFGPGIPVQGLDVVVTVTNLSELYDRYLQVTSGNRGSGSRGPNLTEPLLGGAQCPFLNDNPSRSTADHIAPLLSCTPCSARSQDRKAARVMSAWAVMWAASALSCAGVNLRGRWPRRVLALTSPVRRRRISAL